MQRRRLAYSVERIAYSVLRTAVILILFFYPLTCVVASAELDYRQARLKEDHVRAARIYYEIQEYDKAVEQLEAALEIDPSDKRIALQLETARAKPRVAAKHVIPEGKPQAEDIPLKMEEKPHPSKVPPKSEETPPMTEEEAPPKIEEEVPPKSEPIPEGEPVEEKKPSQIEMPAVPIDTSTAPDRDREAVDTSAGSVSTLSVSRPLGRGSRRVDTRGRAKEPIVVNGDRVEYFQADKKVVGSGRISIEYKGIRLTCDKVTVYIDTREAVAEGNVRITQAQGVYLTGDKIIYDFETQKGSVISGFVSARPFYGKASKVEKAGEREFVMNKGYVTTCDLDEPHYRIQSKQVKIYLEDRVVAKHTFFYLWKTPIFYLPYYVQPLRQIKKSHITVIPGKSSDWGYYVLTAYRYYFNDKSRGDILLDYRAKKGLAGGVNHYYDTTGLGSGSAKFYYTEENNELVAAPYRGETRTRYRYQFRHKWDDVGDDKDTVGIVEFNKLSDPDVIKDYFYKEHEELQDPNDYNYISVITTKPDYTSQFLIKKRFDKFFTVVERLPEYTIDIKNSRLIESLPVYYKANASAAYLNKTFQKTVPEKKDVNLTRVDTNNQLSYPIRLFRFLSVMPYAGTEQTYYSRNKWGDTNLIRGVFNTGLDNSTKFYKIYDVETNYLRLDIHKLRHIITPTANFYYTHQPTISPDNLNQFDSIDAVDTANGVRLALENKLQTKRGDEDNMKSVDLATFIVSTDYMYRLKEGNTDFKSQKFKAVDFQLETIPYPWLYTLAKMSINTKRYAVQSSSIDVTGSGGDKWALGVGYRFEDVESGKSNLVTLGAMYKINEKWRARIYERFDLQKGAFEEQEYTIYRDLHCWLFEATYNVKANSNDQTLWFALRLKAFPDLPIGLRRTYYRPRFGAAGA